MAERSIDHAADLKGREKKQQAGERRVKILYYATGFRLSILARAPQHK